MASKKKNKKLPNFKLSGSGIKFPIKTFLGGNLTGSVEREGKKGAKGRIGYKIPIEKMPIIKSLFGYKKGGGKVDRPKGIKIAERGFGKAMKRGK
tara:strand:- start:218 stop:502 length:285 start_codon:yes stop_codon:yes gene_type:complete